MKKIILASASPRRKDLLKQIGLDFQVMASNLEEDLTADLAPERLVQELAGRKAREVAGKIVEGIIIAADTVVVSKGKIMGKPVDTRDAHDMLRELSGSMHEVITGVAIIDMPSGRETLFHETTKVNFKDLTASEIQGYIKSGEPLDKAGAYAIQGLGAILVAGIDGCYSNVVGLPLAKLAGELKKFGISVL